MVLVALGLLMGAPPADVLRLKARAALALAFAEPSYAAQYALAVRRNEPLAVFVGVPPRPVPGFVVAKAEAFPGVTTGVVVGVPAGGTLTRHDLPAGATDAQLADAARRPGAAVLGR